MPTQHNRYQSTRVSIRQDLSRFGKCDLRVLSRGAEISIFSASHLLLGNRQLSMKLQTSGASPAIKIETNQCTLTVDSSLSLTRTLFNSPFSFPSCRST